MESEKPLSLDLLEMMVREWFGWPEPTERTSNAFAWTALDGDGNRQVVAAWMSEETHVVVDPLTGHPSTRPTGRSGIFVTGRGTVCTTVKDAMHALEQVVYSQYEPLLTVFGLRREWSLPNSPVVPIDKVYSHEERAAVLQQQGIW